MSLEVDTFTLIAVVALLALVGAAVLVPILRKSKFGKKLSKRIQARRKAREERLAKKQAIKGRPARKRRLAKDAQLADVEEIDWSDDAFVEKAPTAVMDPLVKLKKKDDKRSLVERGLSRTRKKLLSNIRSAFTGRQLDEEVINEIRDSMLTADMGPEFTEEVVAHIREKWHTNKITDYEHLEMYLKDYVKKDLKEWDTSLHFAPVPPTVILIVGVNGSGKTTSIAKLARSIQQGGRSVIFAAADTFRAAADDQLSIWAERVGVDVIKHKPGADPAAVAYDAAEAAKARGIDVLIVDTAGRLHTQKNLMNQLNKIKRVLCKKIDGAPHEVLMVLDATTGQNAISQAKLFTSAVEVTGIFLSKLDSTAKGGCVMGMKEEIDIPVKFVGLGETADDIAPFDPDLFIDAMFD
ncbi:MAG: signal recognition particle-docking protein FtsY [Planctomycetota bacterium]